MRRILFLLIATVLASASYAEAQCVFRGSSPGVKGYAAASCTTANDSDLDTISGTPSDSTAAKKYIGEKIVLAKGSTITEYQVNLCRTATASENYTISLYTDNGSNAPSATPIAGTSVTFANADMTTCYSYVNHTFTLAATKAVSAGTYWLVINSDSGKVRWSLIAATGDTYCYTDDTASWTCSSNKAYLHILRGCQ